MFTDIVGYTALMGSDEDKAIEILEKNTEIHNKLIAEYNGALIKAMGDGMLISFNLASDAVRCAIEIQKTCKEQDIPLRIGIHEGEMVFAEADVLGDAVNIASRLQEDSDKGCIHISSSVYKNVRNKADINTRFVEERTFKNVAEPVKVYQVLGDGEEQIPVANNQKSNSRKYLYYVLAGIVLVIAAIMIWNFLPVSTNPDSIEPEKSIAVLPFKSLSEDPEKQYLADGVMDAILLRLSKIEDLRVILRTSVEQYRNTTKSIPEIAGELQVNHILEGSFQKYGDQARLIVQLSNTEEKEDHIWAEEYNRDWSDIFSVQTEVSQDIANELKAVITPEENARITSIPTNNSEAYDLYLQASWETFDDVSNSIELLEKAIDLDPEFADAYALLGFLKSQFWWFGKSEMSSAEEAFNTGMPYYEKALELDPDNVVALERLISNLVLYRWDFEQAEEKTQILLKLNPNAPQLNLMMGRFKEAMDETESRFEIDPFGASIWMEKIMIYYFNNMEDEALQAIETARNYNFRNPHLDMDITRVYLFYEKYDEVLEQLNLFFENYEDAFINASRPLGFLAIAKYHTGKQEEAQEILEKLKKRSEGSSAGSPSYYITMIYAQMGEIDLAFQWLEKAYIDREVEMYWLKVVPLFEPLHDDPRWQEMLDKVGFPD
jgi:TolB-like protein